MNFDTIQKSFTELGVSIGDAIASGIMTLANVFVTIGHSLYDATLSFINLF